jgi:hypothetical protein
LLSSIVLRGAVKLCARYFNRKTDKGLDFSGNIRGKAMPACLSLHSLAPRCLSNAPVCALLIFKAPKDFSGALTLTSSARSSGIPKLKDATRLRGM